MPECEIQRNLVFRLPVNLHYAPDEDIQLLDDIVPGEQSERRVQGIKSTSARRECRKVRRPIRKYLSLVEWLGKLSAIVARMSLDPRIAARLVGALPKVIYEKVERDDGDERALGLEFGGPEREALEPELKTVVVLGNKHHCGGSKERGEGERKVGCRSWCGTGQGRGCELCDATRTC